LFFFEEMRLGGGPQRPHNGPSKEAKPPAQSGGETFSTGFGAREKPKAKSINGFRFFFVALKPWLPWRQETDPLR